MKNVQIIVKQAIIKIRDTASTAVKFIGNASIKQKVILGSSIGGSVLLIIGGLVVFNLHNSKTGQDEVITLTSSDGTVSTITASQIANAETTKGVSPDASATVSTGTVVPAVVPDGHGGVIANPAITDANNSQPTEGQSQPTTSSGSTQQSTPKQSGSTQQAASPKQSQPAQTQTQQPSTPSRMSGAEMTNFLKSGLFNGNTNNDTTGSQLQICTPEFLSSAMPIIDSYINGGLDSGTAKSRLQSLNGTGSHPNQYGINEVTLVHSVNIVDFTVPGSTDKYSIDVKCSNLQGSGVTNLLVTYDSNSDTYHLKGIQVDTGLQGTE